MTHTITSGAQLFARENREAKRLGFLLQCRFENSVAYARLTPATPKLKQACRLAAAQTGDIGKDAIEARQPYADADVMSEALRDAIHSALQHAHEVVA